MPGVWFAFLLIGIQNVRGKGAVVDSGNLPGEVHRVTHSCPHALADEWGSEVCRVAEDEDVPPAPPLGDLGAERVLGDAQQCQLAVPDIGRPRPDQWSQGGQGGEVIGTFAGQQLKLPAVAGCADAHVGSRANRITCLVHAFPLLEVGAGGDVDDQPALLEVQIVYVRAHSGAHHAVGAVATQQIIGIDPMNRAIGSGR